MLTVRVPDDRVPVTASVPDIAILPELLIVILVVPPKLWVVAECVLKVIPVAGFNS